MGWASRPILSHKAAKNFLFYFGALYLGDGLLGLITGSGYLDLGIINYGWQQSGFHFQDFRQHSAHCPWRRGAVLRAVP